MIVCFTGSYFLQLLIFVQSVLAPTVVSISMDQIAIMADKIIEFSTPPNAQRTVAGSLVSSSSQQFSLPSTSDPLTKIEALSLRMDSLYRDCKPSNLYCRCSRSRDTYPSSSRSNYCLYHTKCLDRAYKCFPLCSFPKCSGN